MAMRRAKTKRRERRGPGRPRGETPQQRERLLDAALACYAGSGIGATSLRSIAAEADVTPALVHYYFGSKEQLLDTVVAERFMPVVASLRADLDAAGADARAAAATFVRAIHSAVERHPWLPSLWVREILMEGGALRSVLLESVSPQVPRVLAGRFAGALSGGRLNADLDPRLLVVSLIGLTLFPLAAAPIWRRMFDADDIDGNALLEHTLALVDRGIGETHED